MKLGVLAASTLLGVVAFVPASFAQGDGTCRARDEPDAANRRNGHVKPDGDARPRADA